MLLSCHFSFVPFNLKQFLSFFFFFFTFLNSWKKIKESIFGDIYPGDMKTKRNSNYCVHKYHFIGTPSSFV